MDTTATFVGIISLKTMEESQSSSKSFWKWFECVPTRFVLYLLLLTCVMVSFMMRTIMPITILAMVKEYDNSDSNNTVVEKLCHTSDNSSTTMIHYGGTLVWSVDVQYYVLTSFYWTYIIAQVAAGIVVQRLGTKIVVGYALLTAALCSLCIPFASEQHYVLVIILELFQGFALGFTWPAIYAVIICWVPIDEKSRFVTCFQGMSIGTMSAQIMSGFIITAFGWRYVFYTVGILGLLWCIIWYFLACDTPELHSRILIEELNYIKRNREPNLSSHKRKIPWMSMICSIPMWAIAIVSFGRIWFAAVISTYGPLYLRTIIGLEVRMNGTWSGITYFACFASSLIFSFASDKLESRKIISTVANRKLFTAIGQIFPGLLIISTGYIKCNIPLLLTVWSLSQIICSANFAGAMVNVVEITPNFAGPAIGLIQTLLMTPSIFSTLVAKSFLNNGSTLAAWRGIFNITGGVLFTSYMFYFIFASSTVQKWDGDKESKSTNRLLVEKDSGEQLLVS